MKFSVLIPTKDRLELLKYTVDSILRQTYDAFEIIISDNNSQQDIGKWAAELEDDRIVYFRQEESVSVTENWNKANGIASGDYLIMLGDDDALLPEALQILRSYIDIYHDPMLIEFPAYQYLQPGVDPHEETGTVWLTSLLFGGGEAGLIAAEERQEAVKQCLHFCYVFGFNMQFFCYSKRLVEILEQYGNFYEPPYPDYYTACMMMLKAETVLHIPERLTVIGITRKSYGYYYRNNIEKEGMEFHMEADYRRYAPEAVRGKLCSIDEMHTAAFVTFSLLPLRTEIAPPDLLSYYRQVVRRVMRAGDFIRISILFKTELFPNIDDAGKNSLLSCVWQEAEDTVKSKRSFITSENKQLSFASMQELLEAERDTGTWMNRFICMEEKEEQELNDSLSKIHMTALKKLTKGRKIVIWGAYSRGQRVKDFLEENQLAAAGFLDKNPNIKEFCGLPVWRPDQLPASMKHVYFMIPLRTAVSEVIQVLEEKGCRYMQDYCYWAYSARIALLSGDFNDVYGNTASVYETGTIVYLEFAGTQSKIEITEHFHGNDALLIHVCGSGLNISIGNEITLKSAFHDLKQIRVRYGNGMTEPPYIECMDCVKDRICLPSPNGFVLVFRHNTLLAGFRIMEER